MTRLVVLQHLEREGPGLFAVEARTRGWEVLICRLDRAEPLPLLQSQDCLLVLGGPMGVADLGDPAFPWLAAEVELLRQVLRRGQPVIGVCLGAQLLALAAGGTAVPLVVGEPPQSLREDAAYVIEALGPQGPAQVRADGQRWAERLQQRGRRLVANLFDQLIC